MTSGADDKPPRGEPAAKARPRPKPTTRSTASPDATPARPSGGRKARPDQAPRRPVAPPPQRTDEQGGPGSQRRAIVILSVLTAVAVGLVVYAVAGSGSGGSGRATTPILPPADPSTTVPTDQLTSFSDPETGFSIQYPKSWQKVGAPVRDLRLALDAGGGAALSIRVVRTEQPTTAENIDNLDAFTQAAVNLNPSAKIIRKDKTTLAGMPAYYYLYTFRDDETGQEGVHAHYFAFQGRKMNVLVFQVLPADDFERLAPTFDQVAESFRSDPDIAPSTTLSTTTTAAASPG